MLSAPTSTAPAASIRSIKVASRRAGANSRLIFDPARVGSPCTSNRFFTANGTPASGPGFLPAAIAASTERAFARARSAVTSVKAFRAELCWAIRASAASVTPSASIFRPATACAISAADSPSLSDVMARSCCKDTGWLGFVWQHEFIDQPRQPQRYFEIDAYRRLPGVLDRKAQGFRNGVDIIIKRTSGHHFPFDRCSVNRQRRMWNRAQQFPCIGILRVTQDAFGRALFDDLSRPH